MRIIASVILWIVSVGWLLPAYFSIRWFFDYERLSILPKLYKYPEGVSSFPYFAESVRMFLIAFVWLALAVGTWATFGVWKFMTRRLSPPS